MSSFRFVHAADLHLDTPFTGIGRVAPETQEALRDASLDALDAVVDLAIAREAAFVLLAGDIYDGAERGLRAQIRFRHAMERLAAGRIHVVMVHGNHDPLEGWSAVRGGWPDGVTLLGSAAVESVPIDRGGERLATVHGISYGQREVSENLAVRFQRGSGPGLHIGLLHCNVGGDVDHAPYSPCSVDDLRRAGMDYWALGHVHQHRVVRAGEPWIVYPGNTQGRSPKPSECGPKGAVVVETEAGAVRRVDFVPVDRVRFVHLDVDISGLADVPALAGVLLERADELRLAHNGRALVVRTSLVGRATTDAGSGVETAAPSAAAGELHEQLRRPGAIEALLQELRHEVAGARPFLRWEEITDRTRPRVEPEAIRRRHDFSAELLGLGDALAADPARLASLLEDRSEPLRRIARACSALPPEVADVTEVLREAQALALDLLEADGTP